MSLFHDIELLTVSVSLFSLTAVLTALITDGNLQDEILNHQDECLVFIIVVT